MMRSLCTILICSFFLMPFNSFAQSVNDSTVEPVGDSALAMLKVHRYLLSRSATIYVAYEQYSGALNALNVFDQDKGMLTLRSLTPETNSINDEPDQPNPLFNAHIELLKLVDSRPALTIREKPAHIYQFDLVATDSYQRILVVENLCDAQGAITAGIQDFCAALSGATELSSQYMLVAVKGAQGAHFGVGESGLALIKTENIPVENGPAKKRLQLLDATTGQAGARAASCTVSDLCRTTDMITVLPESPTLCWHTAIERLYVGMHVQLADDAQDTDCCSALAMAAIDSRGALRLDPVAGAPDSTLPFMARGPGGQAHIHHLADFTLKNRLNYLIMVGGSGSAYDTSKKVYALPLANHGYGVARAQVMDDRTHGAISAYSHTTQERIQDLVHYKLLRTQTLEQVIDHETPAQLSKSALIVGGGDAPGTISQMMTVENCVYIATVDGTATEPAGIFYSQALYRGDGTIFGWTPWRRFAAIKMPVMQFTIDSYYNFCRYIGDADGAIVSATSWRTQEHPAESFAYGPLMARINADFAQVPIRVALDVRTNNQNYLLLAGHNKVALYAAAHAEAIYIYENDRLLEIGQFTSAASIEQKNGITIALGGERGAALIKIDSIHDEPQTDCTIVPHKYVIEKVQAAATRFFMLTYEGLYVLSARECNAPVVRKVLDGRELKSFLYDFVLSWQGGLLATARDLYSFRLSADGALEHLAPVGLPLSGRETVRSLTTLTPDGSAFSLSKGTQVYALISNVTENYSHVYRLCVYADELGNVCSEIAENFKKKNGQFYPFLIFPSLQQACITDGVQMFAIAPAMQQTKPRLFAMRAGAEDIMIMSKYTMHAVRLKMKKTTGIRDMFWSKALATWIVAGDFGIRLLQ